MQKRTHILASLVLVAAVALGARTPCDASEAKTPCTAPAGQTKLYHALAHVARKLHANLPITIVAIGSSSTAGAGATSPKASYPARLEVELHNHFPGAQITVINHGVNGDTAEDMLARFERDVIEEKPDLVLWQVGSNSVLRDHPLLPEGGLLRDGIKRIRKTGVDVVLIDPQFAPKILEKRDANGMVDLIDTTAREADVSVFHRFAIMRHWREDSAMPFESFITPDGLHMNDWGYGCWAKLLSDSIAEAATRPVASASAVPPR